MLSAPFVNFTIKFFSFFFQKHACSVQKKRRRYHTSDAKQLEAEKNSEKHRYGMDPCHPADDPRLKYLSEGIHKGK